jgi:hypothetical protein
MIVPTILLVLAVRQRIDEYGVTPERYCLVLFAVWLAAMVAYLGAARGRMNLRVIPASLAIGLVLSSFGPWGAAAISVHSQLAQLRKVLDRETLLSNGQLKLDPPRAATFKHIVSSNKRVASILKSLYDLDALERLAPMFSGMTDSPFTKHLDAPGAVGHAGTDSMGVSCEISGQPPAASPDRDQRRHRCVQSFDRPVLDYAGGTSRVLPRVPRVSPSGDWPNALVAVRHSPYSRAKWRRGELRCCSDFRSQAAGARAESATSTHAYAGGTRRA